MRETGETFRIAARSLINACGPMRITHNQMSGETTPHHHLFSKGIHLIVDRVTPSQKVLTFLLVTGGSFCDSHGAKTCIGTTDTQVPAPDTQVTPEDRQFVLANANALLRLKQPLTEKTSFPSDVACVLWRNTVQGVIRRIGSSYPQACD